MSKRLFVILFFLLSSTFVGAASRDFIVLMDMSENMFDSYDQVVQDYFPEVVKDHLKARDVFHLISFSEHPELELSQQINTKTDMEVVLKRLLLLQPLGKHVDTVLALRFVYQYASGLPAYQDKTIVVFTTGIYQPAPGSVLSKEEAQKELATLIGQIKNKGWDLRFVLLPPPESQQKTAKNGGSQNTGIVLDLNKITHDADVPSYVFQPNPGFSNLTLGTPRITFPSDLGKINQHFTFRFQVKNPSETALLLRLREILYGGDNLLTQGATISLGSKEDKAVGLASTFLRPPRAGFQTGKFQLVFDDDLGAYPNEASVKFDYVAGWEGWLFPLGLALAVLVLLALIVMVVLLLRRGYQQGKALADRHVQEKSLDPTIANSNVENTPITPNLVETSTSQRPVSTLASELASWRKTEKTPAQPSSLSNPPLISSAETPSSLSREPSINSDPQPQMTLPPSSQEKEEVEDRFAGFRGQMEKPDRQDQAAAFLQRPQKEADRFNAFREASKSGERNYDAFLKKTVQTPGSALASVQTNSSIGNVVQAVDALGPIKDFTMLVWTPDFLFQNTRSPANLFRFRPGEKKSVGNIKANFKILLFSVHDVIAEVHYDGKDLSFLPLIGEYFPDLSSPLSPCTGVDIPVYIESNRNLFLRFFPHVSKTEEINRILRGNTPTPEDAGR